MIPNWSSSSRAVLAMSCIRLADDDLADRAFRPRRLAAGERRQGAVARVFQPLGLDVPVGDLLAQTAVLDGQARRGSRCRAPASAPWRWPAPPPPPIASRSFIRVMRAVRQPSPTSPTRWESLIRRSVKYTSLKFDAAGHLLDRPHLDARRLHVDPEHGQALVLGHVRDRCGRAAMPKSE